ncbi:uncharacterized protein O8D03_011451 [Erethizon dorsatum]
MTPGPRCPSTGLAGARARPGPGAPGVLLGRAAERPDAVASPSPSPVGPTFSRCQRDQPGQGTSSPLPGFCTRVSILRHLECCCRRAEPMVAILGPHAQVSPASAYFPRDACRPGPRTQVSTAFGLQLEIGAVTPSWPPPLARRLEPDPRGWHERVPTGLGLLRSPSRWAGSQPLLLAPMASLQRRDEGLGSQGQPRLCGDVAWAPHQPGHPKVCDSGLATFPSLQCRQDSVMQPGQCRRGCHRPLGHTCTPAGSLVPGVLWAWWWVKP